MNTGSNLASKAAVVFARVNNNNAFAIRSMSSTANVWVDKNTRVICQGFTGKQVRRSLSYFLFSFASNDSSFIIDDDVSNDEKKRGKRKTPRENLSLFISLFFLPRFFFFFFPLSSSRCVVLFALYDKIIDFICFFFSIFGKQNNF